MPTILPISKHTTAAVITKATVRRCSFSQLWMHPMTTRLMANVCGLRHSRKRSIYYIDILYLAILAKPWYITCKPGRPAAAVRTIVIYSYEKGHILHLSRAENTIPINTKFWTIDHVGEKNRIAKFGCDWFWGFVKCGLNIQFYCFFLVLRNYTNYLALIATKSCKNNFCKFLGVIMGAYI